MLEMLVRKPLGDDYSVVGHIFPNHGGGGDVCLRIFDLRVSDSRRRELKWFSAVASALEELEWRSKVIFSVPSLINDDFIDFRDGRGKPLHQINISFDFAVPQ